MNAFERALRTTYEKDALAKIEGTRVGIIGAGGLGSNVALCLTRSGFNRFVIADHDKVDLANLNRQFYFLNQEGMPKVEALKENLLRINPACLAETHQTKVDVPIAKTIFSGCAVIVEAVDGAEDKRDFAEAFGWNDGVFFVSATGIAGADNADTIVSRFVTPSFVLVGDGVSETNERCPPYAPRVMVAAAKQANAVLQWTLFRREIV